MIDIDVRGSEQIQQFLFSLGQKGMEIIESELHKIAVNVRNDILKSMRSSPGGGKIYRRGKIFHQASLPGNPPRVDTGNLWNRIFAEKGFDYSKVFTDNVKYAIYLEEGTVKMEARPFFEPAVERSDWQNKIRNRIIAERFAGRKLE